MLTFSIAARSQNVIPIQLQSISYRCGISGVCPIVREKDVHVVLPWQKAHKNTTVLKEWGSMPHGHCWWWLWQNHGGVELWPSGHISKSLACPQDQRLKSISPMYSRLTSVHVDVLLRYGKTAIMWTRRIAWIGGFPLELLQEVWDESLHPDDAYSTGAATSSSTTLPNCESSLKMGTHLVGASTNW